MPEPLAQEPVEVDPGDSLARIVAVRPGAVGDTLLTLPSLALLRRRWPAARLAFVARRDVLPLAQTSGLADVTSSWDDPDWGALFMDSHRPAGAAHALLAGADAVVAWMPDSNGEVARRLAALGARRVIMAAARPPRAGPDHGAMVLARGLLPLDVTVPSSSAELATLVAPLKVPSSDERSAGVVWASLRQHTPPLGPLAVASDPPIALHPGSGGATKRWPPERFAALIARLLAVDHPALLIEGPQDDVVVRAVLAELPAASPAPAIARELSLGELAALLKRCATFVGNDSGVAHLAGLVGLPTLVLFGPTDPRVWAPLGPRVTTLRAPEGDLARLAVADVWQSLAALLA